MKFLKNVVIWVCLLLSCEIFYGQGKVEKKIDIEFARDVKMLKEQKRLGDELNALDQSSKKLDKQKNDIKSAEKKIEKRKQNIKNAQKAIEKTNKKIAKKQQNNEIFKSVISASKVDEDKRYKGEIKSKEQEVKILKLQAKLAKQQKELDDMLDVL